MRHEEHRNPFAESLSAEVDSLCSDMTGTVYQKEQEGDREMAQQPRLIAAIGEASYLADHNRL